MQTLGQIGMTLTHQALALAGLAAVTIPVAIHLLSRMRRRRQPWGAMRFLFEAYQKHRTRVRLENLLLLALRCLIPLLLGLALSQPLLSGASALVTGAAGGQGRLVCVVLDDSLSTRAETSASERRFDQYRRLTLELIDQLAPGDRVAVWRAARPADALIAPLTDDHAAAREQVQAAQPRYSRSGIVDALRLVRDAIAEQPHTPEQCVVVLLSDFSGRALPTEPPPSELEALGEQAELLVLRPAASTTNEQIAAVTPDRAAWLAGDQSVAGGLAARVRLRRYGLETGAADRRIRLEAYLQDRAQPIAVAHRDYTWSPGQSAAELGMSLDQALTAIAAAGAAGPDGDFTLVLRASLEGDHTSDALPADDTRWGTVRIRRGLHIGLIATGAGHAIPTGANDEFNAERWLRLALTPWAADGDQNPSGMHLQPINGELIADELLEPLDAVLVAEPQRLQPDGWDAIGRFAKRGGVVWLFAPTQGGAAWADRFRAATGLDWAIGLEPVEYESASGEQGALGWGLAEGGPAPTPLGMLAADWRSLLLPVRLTRRLDITLPTGSGEAWLSTDDGAPLLTYAGCGDGHILLMGTALDLDWTNLPTRPLFVPLLHETLRGLVSSGASNQSQSGPGWVCGDTLNLKSHQWKGARALTPDLGPAAGRDTIALRQNPRGLTTESAVQLPGVYRVAGPGAAQAVAVNVDADDGDTTAMNTQALEAWLTALGDWRWLDPAAIAGALTSEQQRAGLGWPLLFAAALLVFVETAAARWCSHAHAAGPSTIELNAGIGQGTEGGARW